MADEPVVVLKFWPVKAGNSVEGKTGTTRYSSFWGLVCVKSRISCEGVKFI
ncbi:hypothetical protein [Desulfopila aestuarii]|uniref:hypothetical protein n=1 Tax=Desulfopila aestuarii TaxID=231440 RepID=UPI001F2EBE24|nr:hypothetical protein [Desulfopila aestuarii]